MSSLFYGLPLIAADQAQKHVTANEATDALSALLSGACASRTAPAPASPAEGAVHVVPAGGGGFADGTGAALAAGDVAVFLGGAWHGGRAPVGARLFVRDEGAAVLHAGSGAWIGGDVFGASAAVGLGLAVAEATLTLAGASTTAAGLLPDRAVVLGVVSTVLADVTGAASFDVGDGTDAGRFGATLGLAAGSVNRGVIGPVAVYAPTDVIVTANGGSFTGGTLRLSALFIRSEVAP